MIQASHHPHVAPMENNANRLGAINASLRFQITPVETPIQTGIPYTTASHVRRDTLPEIRIMVLNRANFLGSGVGSKGGGVSSVGAVLSKNIRSGKAGSSSLGTSRWSRVCSPGAHTRHSWSCVKYIYRLIAGTSDGSSTDFRKHAACAAPITFARSFVCDWAKS